MPRAARTRLLATAAVVVVTSPLSAAHAGAVYQQTKADPDKPAMPASARSNPLAGTIDIEKGWFGRDSTHLYVKMRLADVVRPADLRRRAPDRGVRIFVSTSVDNGDGTAMGFDALDMSITKTGVRTVTQSDYFACDDSVKVDRRADTITVAVAFACGLPAEGAINVRLMAYTHKVVKSGEESQSIDLLEVKAKAPSA